MRTLIASFFILALALAASGAPSSLSYKVGDFFAYTFSSQVQTGTQNSLGALSTMSGTVEVECQSINKKGNYLFAMNMFDVVVDASNPHATLAPASRPLGYDMYFEQTPSGQVVNVWYQNGDEPYYVEVKLGAINSFHTTVIASGTTSTVEESDVVGEHSSLYTAQTQSDSSLALVKGFNQADVSMFVDPSLKPSNVVLKAQGSANVHPNGYIQATSVSQTVTLTTMDAPTAANADGWESLLSAQGSLNLKIKPSATQKRLSAPITAERLASPEYISGTLSSLGAFALNYARSLSPARTEVSSEELRALVDSDKIESTKLRRVAAFFRAHPDKVQTVFEPLFVDKLPKRAAQRLFAVLAASNVPSAHDILIRHGIQASCIKKRLAAINTISVSQIGSPAIRDALWELVKADTSLTTTLSRAAVLAFGSVLSRSPLGVRKHGLKQLMTLKSVAATRNDDHAVSVIESAMYNSLPRPADIQGVPVPTPGSMPFNKSWSKAAEYGSVNTVGAQYAAEYFVGTNFDCHQDSFNYLALVSSNASISVFQYTQDVFTALAVYGREGPQLIGNELYLQVFLKVVVDMQIPNQDCKAEHYDVGSFTAPGVAVSYTLWVGCIPVVFEAGVHFEADLSWGWSICQSNLYAQVSATPQATLAASASAQTNLLIVEGQVAFEADFAVSITPQAFVDGDKCTVGVDVTLTANPMQASIVAEYRKKKCEWWIFDCKWSDWTADTLWSWSAPKDNEVLFEKTWPISA